MVIAFERHHITIEEYHRMVEAGVFEDARLELLDGELIETMAPTHPPHTHTTSTITEALIQRLAPRAMVRCQMPVTLPNDSEPEPDVTVARRLPGGYYGRHPNIRDVFLLVEVADSTLSLNRRVKIPIYARAGVREVWLVNLVDDEVTVYREPTGAWYASIQTFKRGDEISMIAFPGERFAVDDILPPRTVSP